MIEVEVHQQLYAFLREQRQPHWPHHLTMARLVARALRLERSALMQTGTQEHYRLSYLMPLLLWPGPAMIVATAAVQQWLLMVEIPQLQQWIQTPKPMLQSDRWPDPTFEGLLLTTPEIWLLDRITGLGKFPAGILTILDGVDDLEDWTRCALTLDLHPQDWHHLTLAHPPLLEVIRETQIQLTRSVFHHPPNPYECHLISPGEREILNYLYNRLQEVLPLHTPPLWRQFWQQWQLSTSLTWMTIARPSGQFSLHTAPSDVADVLGTVWSQQPVILIGNALDLEAEATLYRQRIGIRDLTCLKFAPDRQQELIQLYLPDHLPMPNTPQFQPALLQEIRQMLALRAVTLDLTVIVVGDMPLKAQLATVLAAEFGSRVQVEKTSLEPNGILVTGWEFWQQYQGQLPAPRLLAIATLPIPSLENPLVAGRVAYYKRSHQDWFRLYLLPTALSTLQRAIAPVRSQQGTVALFDSRVLHRSYGKQVLTALSPLARINYLESGVRFSSLLD
ncbi:helicase [Neosynechococcus sphagnicola sy1]|uniref:Helicase n=1 Tax=Neosynechococcus sphagnicola sy1 TaxID=1497020 RepID=A0A098TNM0_9CYAN|nr:helicase C-terminal domain-containing protein [Neosynechococcus sphagnicola]KGF72433.1 helicase [Neosynechococcus sphagnicola sy1]